VLSVDLLWRIRIIVCRDGNQEPGWKDTAKIAWPPTCSKFDSFCRRVRIAPVRTNCGLSINDASSWNNSTLSLVQRVRHDGMKVVPLGLELHKFLREPMEIQNFRLSIPESCNIIVGQSHFIKTAEDLYEVMTTGCPHAKFGLAFCEASGPCLIRVEGNDLELKKIAAENAMIIGAGHTFVILLRDAFPLNVLNALKSCPEVCHIYCATSNALEVVVVETEQGRGILGVIDGYSPKGVETEADVQARRAFLRRIGYKQ